jgi:hypothetical protein
VTGIPEVWRGASTHEHVHAQAVGLAVSAYHKAGCLEGDILKRLSHLTLAMLKGQGPEAFRDPALISDMICESPRRLAG